MGVNPSLISQKQQLEDLVTTLRNENMMLNDEIKRYKDMEQQL